MRLSPLPTSLLAGVLALSTASAPAAGPAIPETPDKLTFKPFSYKPPSAKQFRTQLKAGPVAYVAEDRELPLVTVTVTLRGGSYLDPAGKEGLAELAGYLIARGGTKKRTAAAPEERLAVYEVDRRVGHPAANDPALIVRAA